MGILVVWFSAHGVTRPTLSIVVEQCNHGLLDRIIVHIEADDPFEQLHMRAADGGEQEGIRLRCDDSVKAWIQEDVVRSLRSLPPLSDLGATSATKDFRAKLTASE